MSLKRNILTCVLSIWIVTILLGHKLEVSNVNRTPQPYRQNSLGGPVDYTNFVQAHEKQPKPPVLKPPILTLNESLAQFKAAKKILFFTSYFHMPNYQFGFGQRPFFDYGCPVTNCYTTNNKSLLRKSLLILNYQHMYF
jgi:hypothetical protein